MKNYIYILLLIFVCAGCTSQNKKNSNQSAIAPAADANSSNEFEQFEEEFAVKKAAVADPLEPYNRTMYNINDKIYIWIANPVMKTYKNAVPEPARICIGNFFNNIRTAIRFVSCLAQGKGKAANIELKRFGINTTAGVLGFGDPAKDKCNLISSDEDIAQALAVHGCGNGFYFVWPILGPSTLRDSVGTFGDGFLNPIWYIKPVEIPIGIISEEYVNKGSFHIGDYEAFKEAAVDPYAAMKAAYIQYRENLIHDTKAAEPNSESFKMF